MDLVKVALNSVLVVVGEGVKIQQHALYLVFEATVSVPLVSCH